MGASCEVLLGAGPLGLDMVALTVPYRKLSSFVSLLLGNEKELFFLCVVFSELLYQMDCSSSSASIIC